MTAMVVCPEPPAARVGGEILARGGNAAEAAVATAFAQGAVNPLLCGLSGTAILLHPIRAAAPSRTWVHDRHTGRRTSERWLTST